MTESTDVRTACGAGDKPRPLWSVVIPTHNAADLLALALDSVLGQLGHRRDVEIVVVDDGSTDRPDLVVAARGCPVLRYERSEEARGAVPNFNHCIGVARGELVHLLHCDDLVLPGFYDAMQDAFAASPCVAAFCRTQHIDADGAPLAVTRSYQSRSGIWPGAAQALMVSNRVATPSIVVRADAYDRVGGFDENLPHAADWDMWARLARHGSIFFVDRVLAQYRVHGHSDTAQRLVTGSNMEERYRAMRHVQSDAPAGLRRSLRRRGLALGAMYAARQARRLARRRQFRACAVQACWVPRSLWRMLLPG